LQLVDFRVEVNDGYGCGAVLTLEIVKVEHEGVATVTTGHGLMAARCHWRVIQIPSGQGLLAR
jgi:hypothetical protein